MDFDLETFYLKQLIRISQPSKKKKRWVFVAPIKVEIFFAVTLTLQNSKRKFNSVLFAIKKIESQKELQTQ